MDPSNEEKGEGSTSQNTEPPPASELSTALALIEPPVIVQQSPPDSLLATTPAARLSRWTTRFVTPFRFILSKRELVLDHAATRWVMRIAIAAFLICTAVWLAHDGMRMRRQAWMYSRTIRFHGDIRNAINWGGRVLENARQPYKDSPALSSTDQPSLWQLICGERKVYQDLVDGEPGGDYQLDYPPLRLMTMSIWTRYVQRSIPGISDWPGPWRLKYSSNGDPQTLVSEDIATPLLRLNDYAAGTASVTAFCLVWLWVHRGGRYGTKRKKGSRAPARPGLWEPTPLSQSRGLLVFLVSAPAFFYALSIAVTPAPSPPPSVIFDGPPIVFQTPRNVTATIHATINPQGARTQWHVDWGTTPGFYDQSTSTQDVGDGGAAVDVAMDLNGLPVNQIVHYRITARNDDGAEEPGRGTTHTDDAILNTRTGDISHPQPSPPSYSFNELWLNWQQWLGIAIVYCAMCWSMKVMPPEHRGWACGLVAAVLLWFNPAILACSDVWPQWDVWVLPPFLLAALFASLDCWFIAGLVVGFGAMFKGQFLVCAPVFILWPLLGVRLGALARLLSGAVLMSGAILSPWLMGGARSLDYSPVSVHWVKMVMLAVAIAAVLTILRKPLVKWLNQIRTFDETISLRRAASLGGALLVGVIIITTLVLRGWPLNAELPRSVGLWLLLAILIPPWFLRKRALGVWAAAILGVSIWCSAYLYHGDWCWKTVGFDYGASKFDRIAMGKGSNGNLASILAQHFGWEIHDTAFTLRLPNLSPYLPAGQWVSKWGLDGIPMPLDTRQTLIAIFGICLIACGIGAAINDRRNHPSFLAALVAPWMLMPNLLCQMMNRYQLWGAALSSMLVAISSGFGVMNVIISLLAAGMIGNQLLTFDTNRSPQLHDLIGRLSPDDGWIMLYSAAIVLFVAMVPGARFTRQAKLELPTTI